MKNKLKLLLAVLLLTGTLSGCKTGKPIIGVTVYPVQYLVQRLAEDKVDVVMFSQGTTIQRATIINDYAAQLKRINVLFRINQLESYYEVYRKEIDASQVKVVDLSITAGLYSFHRYTIANVAGSEVTVESDYYKGDVFTKIDTYDKDPMLWMDPIAMTSMAKTILQWLLKNYPEEAKLFNANYKILEAELARLDAEYQSLRLQKKFIAFASLTPSYGNWQKTYGFEVYPVFLSRYGVYPSDAQIQLIKQRIIADGVEYIALEDNLPEDMKSLYASLKSDLDLKGVILHNIAFLSEADIAGNKNYFTLMYENLDQLEAIAN
ncbi:MAG: zinc ABC transporter substrate-binding protein [Erysipelotrichaceae bacterium]